VRVVARIEVLRVLLALSLVVTAVHTSCPKEAGSDFNSVRTFALQLQQQGDSEEAIECFEFSARLDTSRPEPWLSIGEIYRAAGQHSQAISALRKCCAIASTGGRPGWALAHFNLANALKDAGEPQEAVLQFEKSLALDPPFKPAIYNNMALALGALNRNDEVLQSYHTALTINPAFPETHNNLASHYQVQCKTISLSNNLVSHYQALGQLSLSLGGEALQARSRALHRALMDTRTLIELYGHTTIHVSAGVLILLYMCPQALGQLNEAATHYRRAVELRPDRGFMVNLAFVLGARGDTAASIDAVLNLLALLVQNYNQYKSTSIRIRR
jgi:tetratricopeptide (TPR) repeat protein